MEHLKAAFGKVKVTPEETAPLAGYDPNKNVADPNKDILDDLYARIVLVDNGISRKAVVSIDVCLTNEDAIRVPLGRQEADREFINTFPAGTRLSWANAAETAEANVSVNATHTHSAPAHFSRKYTLRIEDKIRELLHQLEPIKLSLSVGKSTISAFRRPFLKPDYNTPIDQTLHVLLFESLKDKMIGSIVVYAVHPTGLRNPKQPYIHIPIAIHNRVSTESVGMAMNEWEEEQGNGFVSLFLQGFSGDVCPIYGHNGEQEDTYPLVVDGGHQFYRDIKKTIRKRRLISFHPVISAQKIIQLPTREGHIQPAADVTLMAIRFGEIALLSVSAEVFNGFVNKIRGQFPFNPILLSGLANGYSGYIPTQEAFQDGMGGYEMGTTPFTEEADDIFVKESLNLLKQLFE